MSRPWTPRSLEARPPLSHAPMTWRFQRNPYFSQFLATTRQLLEHEIATVEDGNAEEYFAAVVAQLGQDVWTTAEGVQSTHSQSKQRSGRGSTANQQPRASLEQLSMVLFTQSEFNRVKGASFARTPKLQPQRRTLPGPGDYNPDFEKVRSPKAVIPTSDRQSLFPASDAPGPGTYYPVYQLRS